MAAILARAGATAGLRRQQQQETSCSGRRRRLSNVVVVAAVTGAAPQEGALERPAWSGETPVSRLVAALIAFKPLYSLMKLASREVIIRTAEKANIPWREMTKKVLESDVYEVFERIRDPKIVYPDYYLSPFHAYDEGNLSWLAAAEAEAATLSIAKRAIPEATSIQEANKIVRGNWMDAIEEHHLKYSGTKSQINDILDIGCSVGVSTRYLAERLPSAKAVGLDLSPYFLAVAAQKEEQLSRQNPIRWVHANGEATGLPSNSFDVVSLAYVIENVAVAKQQLCHLNCCHLPIFASNQDSELHLHECGARAYEKLIYTTETGSQQMDVSFYQENRIHHSKTIITPQFYFYKYLQCHECPARAIVGLAKEAFRLLRPGGTIALTDNSPKSKVLQELSPVLFTLMKSTEPFLDEYYMLDLEEALSQAGFVNVHSILTDPRHRTVTATVPC